nr:DUF3820 family protein [Ignatzschineria sp. RMDPL8A]
MSGELFGKEDLVKLANDRMPFGKYAGRRLIDLPEAYLLWFEGKGGGFPKGELGRLLKLALMLKIDGTDRLIHPLKSGRD